jgi:CRP/FNR family transcriptional regulator, cyclic AMP receptor protein
MFQSINQNISKDVALSQEEITYFNELLTQKTIAKKKSLLEKGQLCDFEAYVIKGCFKVYFLDKNGNEIIISFPVEDWWLGDMVSFHQYLPSKLYIEALENSEIFLINAKDKELLYQKFPKFERVFRLKIHRHLIALQERLYFNYSLSAQERYEIFVGKYPHLLQRIPQLLIANYIGITPESLSRLRKKSLKK